ncbi:MarR family transcriptional regulator [Novosphingobium sp.]|uniref:MarR family transcriptional regulator n=1 Tax=Novosphingobium sp. TaxID=1874826 RepID=UPI00345BF074
MTSLCIAADVPPTTALRWIALLESEGLIERHPDPNDRRRTYIRLNDKMTAAMTRLLSGG